MGNTNNPRILNLDELELAESEITIRHEGVDHKMRVLTVDLFIAQQKRMQEHQRLVASGKFDESADDPTDVVTIIHDAIVEFFPTLPVGELPTPKLFTIFAWLNEMTEKMNEAAGAPIDGDESAEGNAPEAQEEEEEQS